MPAVERKPRHPGVIERRLIERAQLAVCAGVLDVTAHTVSLDITMDTASPGNAIRHRLVTRQALRRRDSFPRLVTLRTIGNPFESACALVSTPGDNSVPS
jgi:hypothetical protein